MPVTDPLWDPKDLIAPAGYLGAPIFSLIVPILTILLFIVIPLLRMLLVFHFRWIRLANRVPVA